MNTVKRNLSRALKMIHREKIEFEVIHIFIKSPDVSRQFKTQTRHTLEAFDEV